MALLRSMEVFRRLGLRKEAMWLWKSPKGDIGIFNPYYTMKWQGHLSHRFSIQWTELPEATNVMEPSDYGMGLLNTSTPINDSFLWFSFVVLGEGIQGHLYVRQCSSTELLPSPNTFCLLRLFSWLFYHHNRKLIDQISKSRDNFRFPLHFLLLFMWLHSQAWGPLKVREENKSSYSFTVW